MSDFNREQIEQRQHARDYYVDTRADLRRFWEEAEADLTAALAEVKRLQAEVDCFDHEHEDLVLAASGYAEAMEGQDRLRIELVLEQRRHEEAKQAAATYHAELAQLRAENERLRDWQATVTAAIQHEGGSFFEDVPKHIRELKAQLAACQQERDEVNGVLSLHLARFIGAEDAATGQPPSRQMRTPNEQHEYDRGYITVQNGPVACEMTRRIETAAKRASVAEQALARCREILRQTYNAWNDQAAMSTDGDPLHERVCAALAADPAGAGEK